MTEIPVSRARLERDATRLSSFQGAYGELRARLSAMERLVDVIEGASRARGVKRACAELRQLQEQTRDALDRASVAFFG